MAQQQSQFFVNGSGGFGTPLLDLLACDFIEPGAEPSYQICKTIYLYHPLGQKLAESPIKKAQSQEREISITSGPEDLIRKRFLEKRAELRIDDVILNTMSLSRVYGIASASVVIKDQDPKGVIDLWDIPKKPFAFSVFDPLNTAGSLVLNQMPNAFDFQKVNNVSVQGQAYHPSRTCVMMNEAPVYIAYTSSAFGYVGRSVYQRALYPLKSYLQTLLTDDMVTVKSGVLIEKLKQPGSVIDNLMASVAGLKRSMVKGARTNSVISIGIDEFIETLNMQNLDGAYGMARTNILKNIATAADMPAVMVENETLTEGFGEGTEDAKVVADYITGERKKMQPLYDFTDRITMHAAWDEDFFESIKNDYLDYKKMQYKEAFYEWKNSFTATWPSLLTEPDSEKIKVDDVKLKAVIALLEVLLPIADPENKVILIEWACDQFNELKLLFGTAPISLDMEAMKEFDEQKIEQEKENQDNAQGEEGESGLQQPKEPSPPKPFRADSVGKPDFSKLDRAIADLSKVRDVPRRSKERRPV